MATSSKRARVFPPAASPIRIAVIFQWPGIRNAEFELIERMKRTEGFAVTVIDYLGFDAETGLRVDLSGFAFALALHYETPKYVDCTSIATIINPVEFVMLADDYPVAALARYRMQDGYAVPPFDSRPRRHLQLMLRGMGRESSGEFPSFFPSLPRGDIMAPVAPGASSRLFYCGINWEKMASRKGRHEGVLKLLDRDALVDIFGPERIQGIRPWKGYRNFRGSIPFDGISMLGAIRASGIGLHLSSNMHYRNRIVSSRIFEYVGAGVPVIADDNPFLAHFFGDALYYFPRTFDDARDAAEIVRLRERIAAEPDAAIERVRKAQDLLRDRYCFEETFRQIHDCALRLKADRATNARPLRNSVTLIVRSFDGVGAIRAAEKLLSGDQNGLVAEVVLLSPGLADASRLVEIAGSRSFIRIPIADSAGRRHTKKGQLLLRGLEQTTAPYIAVLDDDTRPHADHLEGLAEKAAQTGALAVYSGAFWQAGLSRAPEDPRTVRCFFKSLARSEWFDFDIRIAQLLVHRSLAEGLDRDFIGEIEACEAHVLLEAAARAGRDAVFSWRLSVALDGPSGATEEESAPGTIRWENLDDVRERARKQDFAFIVTAWPELERRLYDQLFQRPLTAELLRRTIAGYLRVNHPRLFVVARWTLQMYWKLSRAIGR